jgi:hypothetical protein
MIADINLNVTTMQRRLHRQLLQSLRRRHGPSRFETGQATPPDRARSASEVLSGASPCRRTCQWLWWCIGGQCGPGHRQHCWQSQTAATVTRRRISTPWAPHARCDLVSAYTGTAEQSCKIDSYADLSKLRTVDHDMYSKFVKIGRREIPEEIYPTCLERSGMG